MTVGSRFRKRVRLFPRLDQLQQEMALPSLWEASELR
jgi:hypothetical protein